MRRALVTGGSGAIGAAICRRLASSGLHVVIHTNHNHDVAKALAIELQAAGHSAEIIAFDVTDGDVTRTVLEQLLEAGPIQVLVNNAGIHDDAPLPSMQAEQWRRVLAVSLDGYFNVTQPLLMAMMRTRWGRIINLSSVAGVIGNRGQSNYATAKAGLIGATKSLSQELASRGVTVNAVAPGIIESSMTDSAFPPERICCFSHSLVGSPRELVGVFRRRISWDDGVMREPAGAGDVAFPMNRCCRSGENVDARAPSVGKGWASAAHLSMPCPHGP